MTQELFSGLPNYQAVGPREAAYELLANIWSRLHLPYDWNPNCVWFRSGTGDFAVRRVGGFLVQTFPAPIPPGAVSLLWGRGTKSDVDHLLEHRDLLYRSDAETQAHLDSIDHGAPFDSIPSRDFDDYIYALADQITLEGKKFSRRRTYLRSLDRDYGSAEVVAVDLTSDHAKADLRRVYDRWASWHKQSPTIAAERRALVRSLECGSALGLRCVGLEVEGSLRGFATYDVFGKMSTAHIVKSDRDSAISAGVWQGLFAAAHEAGATRMNCGYDGGLQGLRHAKQGLKPEKMLSTVWLARQT